MIFNNTAFITNYFVLIFFSVVTGLLIGKIEFGKFKLGTSGGLFTGLITGWYIYGKYAAPYKNVENLPAYATRMLTEGIIPNELFLFSLILFVAAVGLLASKDLGKVLKKYGLKFILLGFVITFTGAFICYMMSMISKGQNPYAVSGVYTGALTSSPGLAAALEAVTSYGNEAESMVGFGYAVAYVPGVFIVIVLMQFLPFIFRIDLEEEKELFRQEMSSPEDPVLNFEVSFDLIAFVFACLIGFLLGKIKIYLGATIEYFSLGSTGGVLVASLILGYIGKIGPMHFRMSSKILGSIQELALAFFLSMVGLKYGYTTINSITGSGAYLVCISFLCGLTSLFVGFIVGRYVFKINWIMLSGALCGGMTST
jgi:putative transport protein